MKQCPECGYVYDRLGRHWKETSCSPKLSKKSKEVIEGLVMGDGCIINRDGEPRLRVLLQKESKPYLKYLSNGFGPLCSSVKQRENRVVLNTYSHPDLREWSKWYKSGEKSFPEEMSITRTTIKHWYVCDGGLKWKNGNVQAQLYSTNEKDRLDFLRSLIGEHGFRTRSGYERIIIPDAESFTSWLGEPLPSFEYKFNTSNKTRYA